MATDVQIAVRKVVSINPATGETTSEVIYHLHRTSDVLFREQRRLGLPARALSGRFPTGLYLDYALASVTGSGEGQANGQ